MTTHTNSEERSQLLTGWLVITIISCTFAAIDFLLVIAGLRSAPHLEASWFYILMSAIQGSCVVFLIAILRQRQ